MDYKKAVNVPNKEVVDNGTIDSTRWEDIERAVNELTQCSTKIKVTKGLQDTYCYVMEDNETNLEELVNSLQNRYYFKGMLEDITVEDVHNIFCECCTFTKCEDEDGSYFSDDEPILGD